MDKNQRVRTWILVGISVAFIGGLVLIYSWFSLKWPLWVLIMLIGILILLIGLFIGVGYTVPWTGFNKYISPRHPENRDFQRAKTLWDWTQLAVAAIGAIAIPVSIIALLVSISQFNTQQANSAQQARDQEREALLDTYLDRMSDLIFTNGLATSKPGDEVREIARTRTDAALQNLDGYRKGILIRFLWRANLIKKSAPNSKNDPNPVIPLNGSNLAGAYFAYANLSGADLYNANLYQANLSYANISNVDLSYADLDSADLLYCDLKGTNFYRARVYKTYLGIVRK